MSYDITLQDPKTNIAVALPAPLFLREGTVPARQEETGRLVQIPSESASINITYNYSSYYYEATKGDPRFCKDGKNVGIRGIYGKTPEESVPLLQDMIRRIEGKYQNPDRTWKKGTRKRKRYFDKTGKEVKEPLIRILRGETFTEQTETYEVSEGDTDNYWEETAANAVLPLYQMCSMAVQCFGRDCVWDGD